MSGLLGVFSVSGVLLGLVWALGVSLVVAGLPMRRRVGLADRVMPYLRDTPRPSRLLAAGHDVDRNVVATLMAPVLADLGSWVDRVLGGSASVAARLQRAGLPADVDRFRAEQVLFGIGGGVLGATLSLAAALFGSLSIPRLILTIGVGMLSGVVVRDYLLTRRATQREKRMLAEFPTVAELLALAVGAGEGAVGALDRVTRLSSGELGNELAGALAQARAGASLPLALQGLADRTGLPSLARFVDGIIVAVERGTPLAEVLRAQAQDVREEGRRLVMEEGGRKEIQMMVPVVFLILPVTVVFAVFPAVAYFNLTL